MQQQQRWAARRWQQRLVGQWQGSSGGKHGGGFAEVELAEDCRDYVEGELVDLHPLLDGVRERGHSCVA